MLAACGTGASEPVPAKAKDLPALSGRVVDDADVIPADQEALLAEVLAKSERLTKHQFVVVTVPDLKGEPIADFGVRLGREWRIGRGDIDDGALLIVAPQERQVRIEVGYGLEGILNDVDAKAIIEQTILPRFRAGDMAGGILTGSAAIIREIDVPGATP